MRALFLALFFLTFHSLLWAAPYGEEGMDFHFTQPSGEVLALKAFGDEFYAVMKTPDGFPVILDKDTQTMCYGEVNAEGTAWLSSGIAVSSQGQSAPRSRLVPTRALDEENKRADLSLEAKRTLIEAQQKEFQTDSKGRLLPPKAAMKTTSTQTRAEDGTVYAPPSSRTTGKIVGLTVFVQFKDTRFSTYGYTEEDLRSLFNQRSGFRKASEVCSLREYFLIQSGGKADYTQVFAPIITLDNDQSYYDDNSSYGNGSGRFKKEIAEKLQTLGLDLSSVSTTYGSYIQAMNIIYAGQTKSSWNRGLWPHKSSSYLYPSYQINGRWLGAYQMTHFYTTGSGSSASNQIFRTLCHESGHLLCNFPDLYSYSSGKGLLSTHCLMGGSSVSNEYPSPISAYLKYHAGWATVIDISASENKRLALDSHRNTFLRFKNPTRPNEYFLFEWRGDYGYEFSYNGKFNVVRSKGMLAYHCYEAGSNTYPTVENGVSWNTPYEVMIVDSQKQDLTTDWFFFSGGANLPFKEVGYRSNTIGSYATQPASNTETSAFKWWTPTGKNGVSNMKFSKTSATGTVITTEFGSGTLPSTPAMAVSSSELRFHTTGSTIFGIYNQAQGSFSYKIEQVPSWLTLSSTQGTITHDSVSKITASVNFSQLPAGYKESTLTVKNTTTGETLPLLLKIHNEIESFLSVSPPSTPQSAQESTCPLVIESNLDWEVHSNSDWCVPSQTEGSLSTTLTLSLSANPTSSPREALIVLSAPLASPAMEPQSFTIKQDGAFLTVTPSTWSSPATGGTLALDLSSSNSWSLSLNPEQDWISLSALSGTGTQTLSLNTAPNHSGESRSTQLNFQSATLQTTLTVIQASTKKSYDSWKNEFFGPQETTGVAWNESFSQDGLSNLLKYATGLNPREKHGTITTLSVIEEAGSGQKFLTLSLPFNAEAQGVSFHLEASSNLKDWSEVPSRQEQEGTEKLRLQDLEPLNTQAQRFLRIKVKKTL